MRKRGSWFFLCIALAASQSAKAKILPTNHLDLQDNPKAVSNISPTMFRGLIDQVVGTFSPIVQLHGGVIKVNYLWDDGTVNANADREGNDWILNMYGGLARRPEITPDGFTLVVCHEMGHHLGGYPFKRSMEWPNSWSATEGQSDYFAAQVCAHAIWAHDLQANAIHRYTVDPVAKSVCDRASSDQAGRDLCYRIADAGQSLANLFNQLENGQTPVEYQKANIAIRVNKTVHEGYPMAQCRLETFLNGAICERPFDMRIIPGYDIHLKSGSLLDEEKEAARYSCGDRGDVYDGSRPRCWFKPLQSNW